ncbi:hypothetical protein ACFE04_014330 [Oxalis oulophora]
MASSSTTKPSFKNLSFTHQNHKNTTFTSFPISISFTSFQNPTKTHLPTLCFAAANSQTGPVGTRSSSSSNNTKKRKKKKKKEEKPIIEDNDNNDDDDDDGLGLSDFEILRDGSEQIVHQQVNNNNINNRSKKGSSSDMNSNSRYIPTPLPKAPAGFVVDDQGKVLMASNKRIVTVVDPANNKPLECVIRRVFRSSQEDECMLLCPVDMPVQILKSVNFEGWSAVSDEEVETILPSADYALAKIHIHLVYSGFCYTARGGFCYSEEDIFDFHNGQDVDGLPAEGVEITCFHVDGSHYMIYTPSDPLLFVAAKDANGMLQIADDDLLDDPAVISAIDEETEFNALVEEEAALLESLMGER